MAGVSSKALNDITENKYKFNGIEQNNNFDLNLFDAFYRNLDPQIGRFLQVDPENEAQESYSPYESMGNNPIVNMDPLGDFKYKFGAWLHRVFNGGGAIGKNQWGEWYVTKTSSDGNYHSTTTFYYGKERHKFSARYDEINRESKNDQIRDDFTRQGIWDPNLSEDEARSNLIGNTVGVALPSANFKLLTVNSVNKVLPRSGPIMRSVGSASRAEMLAKKLKLNINSATTRQVLNSLDDTVESFITQFRKASIKSELPGEFLNKTVEEALKSGNTTVRKLLIDNRFVK